MINAANELKKQGVTLITVGLSMSDVKRGSVLLYDIASRDESGEPYFFAAEGDDLQYVLYSIIRTIMQEAIVEGNVSDTINEAFYPVDKNTGRPLTSGEMIDLEGNVTTDASVPHGVIGIDRNGNYTVTWTGMEFTWSGWRGTVYEKAKEDFLGGNAVRTNDPANPAAVEATGYKFNSGDTAIALDQSGQKVPEANRRKTLETPRVNVNELGFTENDTEWTVYLGTEVNPKEQLIELFRNVLVEETVTAASDTNRDDLPDRMTGSSMYYPLQESTSDQRENEGTGSRVTYPLWKLLHNLDHSSQTEDAYLEELINQLMNGSLQYDYDLYGTSDSPGKFTIALTKTGDTSAYDSHVTSKTGTPVETYRLEVRFQPDTTHLSAGQGGTDPYVYHTGDNGTGTCGSAAEEVVSGNDHVINVFAKKLEILKADQSHELISSSPATFVLYRKATEAELVNSSIEKATLSGLTGSYVAV